MHGDMAHETPCSRRAFLQSTVGTAAGVWAATQLPRLAYAQTQTAPAGKAPLPPSQVALTTGESRADNVFRALKMIEPQIRQAIARKKRVIVKPNLVAVNNQLAATHVECLEGILEFLKPIVKDEILIGESPAGAQATEGFDNYKYHQLSKRYNVKLLDFDEMPIETREVADHRYQPQTVRFVKLMLDPDTYVISAAVPKTHDRAICTLSLKNIVVGAAVKDKGFRWGGNKALSTDKIFLHGGPENQAIHYNLFTMARVLRPDLSVLDGYQGMEGNGPVGGTPVDHKIAFASTDFVAADRVGVELMGLNIDHVGYMTSCGRVGLGQLDLQRIEVLGEKIADHKRNYKTHSSFEKQLEWMKRS
jgi:uncharacterized protein (DUF362 family)